MKKQVEAWIKFAERDLLTVSEIIKNPKLTKVIVFHCQQAIEKYFKAFILENERPVLKIHNLLALYGTIKEIIDFELDEDYYIRFESAKLVDLPKEKVFPKQFNPIIIQELNKIKILEARWGLVPFWAKDDSFATKTINARSETLSEKPSFKYAYEKRRCLIPFTGYFEWDKNKVLHSFPNNSNELKSFAGLFEIWGVENLITFTIITCPADEIVAKVHDRMPVVLNEEEALRWIS
jgi:putative SOS response-associated peptidase YedK